MVQDVVDETVLAQANGNKASGRPMNGKPRAPAQVEEEDDDQTKENIFLFIPNLIGEQLYLRLSSPANTHTIFSM